MWLELADLRRSADDTRCLHPWVGAVIVQDISFRSCAFTWQESCSFVVLKSVGSLYHTVPGKSCLDSDDFVIQGLCNPKFVISILSWLIISSLDWESAEFRLVGLRYHPLLLSYGDLHWNFVVLLIWACKQNLSSTSNKIELTGWSTSRKCSSKATKSLHLSFGKKLRVNVKYSFPVSTFKGQSWAWSVWVHGLCCLRKLPECRVVRVVYIQVVFGWGFGNKGIHWSCLFGKMEL